MKKSKYFSYSAKKTKTATPPTLLNFAPEELWPRDGPISLLRIRYDIELLIRFSPKHRDMYIEAIFCLLR